VSAHHCSGGNCERERIARALRFALVFALELIFTMTGTSSNLAMLRQIKQNVAADLALSAPPQVAAGSRSPQARDSIAAVRLLKFVTYGQYHACWLTIVFRQCDYS
jgi:hypothetical protein